MRRSVTEAEVDKLAALCGSLRLHCNSDDIAGHLLEPIALTLGAEAAACRRLRLQHARPQIENLSSIGVPASVSADYLSHFHRLDPFLMAPFDNKPRPLSVEKSASQGFQRYYHDFLYPNHLVHHTGFLVRDARQQRAWVFNFHRPASAPAFSSLEHARSRLIEACLQGQASMPGQTQPRDLADLTSREHEVVEAVARGYTNKQIATALSISPRTVENHLRNIYEKLHIHTRTQLLSYLLIHL